MISKDIAKLIGEAMKAHDTVRLSTLKLLSSAFNYEKIEKQHDLTGDEELNVIRKQAKQRKDSIDAYEKAGRSDLAESEKLELKILQEFLPPEMDEAELNQLISDSINQLGAKTIADLGRVIGVVKSKAPSVEGGKIAELVRQKLVTSH
ncbi:MAG: GatB/YqeY domain-containing protein [Candidatus Woesebacteria bacterium]|nr:MAG: GatB/YqeY domain-containing protein [Candidatus Woesebacteria bacterium]